MMQLPDNLDNGLTKVSLAEWMEGMIIWEYLKQKTDKSFVVESSKNKRAKLPASTLAYALKAPLSLSMRATIASTIHRCHRCRPLKS